jgi:dihydroneopterin aldolase/2-amino-4-hydroxy-6-hydroxymethyldihydropteridine diphosphokinase
MNRARLFLTGIHAEGRHGARSGEKDEPQPFVVDLDLEVEVGADEIDHTADYRGIVEGAAEVVTRDSFDLIEVMAESIGRAVLEASPRVRRATVVVHKPNAARRLGVQGVAAAVTVEAGPG